MDGCPCSFKYLLQILEWIVTQARDMAMADAAVGQARNLEMLWLLLCLWGMAQSSWTGSLIFLDTTCVPEPSSAQL